MCPPRIKNCPKRAAQKKAMELKALNSKTDSKPLEKLEITVNGKKYVKLRGKNF